MKSHSHKVTDVMTRSVITATPETPLSEIATLLERNRIKRVPIVQNGKVVGIVSRANLLQALAGMPTKNEATASANDSQIRDQVLSRSNGELWRPSILNVTVRDGSVDLWGFVTSDDEKKSNPNRRGKHTRRQDDQRSFDSSATRDRNGVTAFRSHQCLKIDPGAQK